MCESEETEIVSILLAISASITMSFFCSTILFIVQDFISIFSPPNIESVPLITTWSNIIC